MTIKDMIEKRAKVWETAKNFVDTHENENGVLSAEDNATYSRMEQEIEDLTAAIDRQQRAEAREAALNQPINTPLTGRPAKQVEEKTGRASNASQRKIVECVRSSGLVRDLRSLTTSFRRRVCRLMDRHRASLFDLESYIAGEFARAFGIAEEEAFCVGTGTGQPTGIFTANGGTVGVTAASATAITADELINLIYSLKSPYRRNAKFLMNDATVSMIRKLKDKNDAYLWQPSLQAGEPDKLLGYDLYTSPYVPTAKAGALTVAFGDFKNYWIADRSGRTVQRLNELYSTNGQVGFVATERVDGKVILPEGIQLLKMKASA